MPSFTGGSKTLIALSYMANPSGKTKLSAPCRPLDVQYVDQFYFAIWVVDFFLKLEVLIVPEEYCVMFLPKGRGDTKFR